MHSEGVRGRGREGVEERGRREGGCEKGESE